ncbi:MAG: hypothetical protein E6H84_08015 [Chloroflexi bacterium]|nr:MAG: hypothetical protein E6H84_08015 [Chloroflexota bacterium]
MNEQTVASAVGSLRAARMSEVASHRVREELERAWRERAAAPKRRRLAIPPFARVFATAALVVALGFVTLRSGADSPLYAFRVAIEDALVAVQADPVAYATELYDERLEEAARFDAVGNALAASRARAATDDALRLLNQVAPKSDQPEPSPSSSTAIFVPSASPTAEPAMTPSPTPTTTLAPTPRPTPRPTPEPTLKPTIKPTTPPPSPSPFSVHVAGTVVYSDGTPVNDACVSTALGGSCVATSVNGTVDFWIVAKKYDTVTFYVQKLDIMTGRTYRGKAYATVTGPLLYLGTITLRVI